MTKTRDRSTPTWLRLREFHGHVTVTPDTMTAWFVLTPQRWSFTTDTQRKALIMAFAHRLAALAGRRVHLRVTAKPYPIEEWAKGLHHNSPDRIPGWNQHLMASQNALRTSTLSEKVVFLGVDLRDRSRYSRWFGSRIAGRTGTRTEIALETAELHRLLDIVAGPGMEGRVARTDEIEWLLHRSVRLGLPALLSLSAVADAAWEPEDLHAFTDGVHYEYDRFGPTVKVSANYDGNVVERHVAVLTLGRMGSVEIPARSRDPWMQHTDRLPFPVEWVSTFDVLEGSEVARTTGRKRLGIRDMQAQYRRHGIEEPLDLARKGEQARRIEDETTDGVEVVATRAYGWHRLAVSAATKEDCLRRVQDVIDSYKAQQITVQHPHTVADAAAQFPLLREFIPGEPLGTTAYKRKLPVRYLAAGLPHVSAAIGDRRGPLMGVTVGSSRRAFMSDPHYATEVAETSGLMPIVGGLGAGKSVLLGRMVYESAMRGITTTVLDPSGPLSNLTRMDNLRDHARHVDLIDGDDGILNPYAVVADPLREFYASDDRHAEALQLARQTRKMLAADVTRMLLPAQVDAMPLTPLVVGDAIRAVGAARTATLWQVVDALDNDGREHATAIANYLRDMADMPQSRLFFPNHVRDLDTVSSDTLMVLTMHGLQLPDATAARETWSTPEQVSVPLLHLASHYTTSRAFHMDRGIRKMVALDEAGKVGQWGSGRALFTNLGRDSRKWNIAAPIASQNPADVLGLNIANWIATAYVGRVEDEDTAREALRLLRIQPDAGYEQVLASLSPQVALPDGRKQRGAREFIVKDVDGNVEKVRIDMSHLPDLLAALNTTPDGLRRAA